MENGLLEIVEKLLMKEEIYEFLTNKSFLIFLERVSKARGFEMIWINSDFIIFKKQKEIVGVANKDSEKYSLKIWNKEFLNECLYYSNIWSASAGIRR